MKLKLAEISIDVCSKPSCGKRIIQRHHKGCERMWLNHFRWRWRSMRYKEFASRYAEFRETDVARICEAHHQEIHDIYFPIIKQYIKKWGSPHHWTWEQAEKLMARLRKECDKWLTQKSPGRLRKRPMPWVRRTKTK